MLESQHITVSGGASLSGVTQGDASHLIGRTVTLNSNGWKATQITDDDAYFDDNDATQTLTQATVINGVSYGAGVRVEAEYQIQLQDPSGHIYTAYGYNVNNSNPAYGTIEGLSFLGPDGAWPPVGVPLKVIKVGEGPGDFGLAKVLFDDLVAPVCFAGGTRLATPSGAQAIERLRVGDMVLTRDHGPQPLRWLGSRRLTLADFAAAAVGGALRRFVPVRIAAGALGQGLPLRDLYVSPQHRVLLSGWQAELYFGEPEVLVAAVHLLGRRGFTQACEAAPVVYWHAMFDRHEIVFAEGLPTESFRAGAMALRAIPAAAQAELGALFPGIADWEDGLAPARPVLSASEAALMCA